MSSPDQPHILEGQPTGVSFFHVLDDFLAASVFPLLIRRFGVTDRAAGFFIDRPPDGRRFAAREICRQHRLGLLRRQQPRREGLFRRILKEGRCKGALCISLKEEELD
jgi:hypothetical protein